jgi:hypothetical protein
MAFGVGLLTPVPRPIAHALIEGLSADSVVKHAEALRVFPEVKLIGFDEATHTALNQLSPKTIERVWDDGRHNGRLVKHEGFFIDHREIRVHASPEEVFQAIIRLIQPGWHIEIKRPNEQIMVCVKDQIAGERWMEWRISDAKSVTYFTQTVFFAPRGLPGFLYWYLLYPIHILSFHGLIKTVSSKSMSNIT